MVHFHKALSFLVKCAPVIATLKECEAEGSLPGSLARPCLKDEKELCGSAPGFGFLVSTEGGRSISLVDADPADPKVLE